MEQIRWDQIKDMLCVVADRMEEKAELLCSLDRQMGDGDLGLTMSKGWRTAADTAEQLTEQDVGRILMKCGMKMSSAVPSTMGTLMASGLMEGGKRLLEVEAMGTGELADFLAGFCEGIKKRGKCRPGDRTVLDAVLPAARAAENCVDIPLVQQMEAVVKAGQEGLEATKSMVPKFGKAAVFAGKAAEMADQGALVGVLILESIRDYVAEDR